jgi:xanthine dehydrogenase YagT iron-sulfur-binding subunit
VTIVTTAPPTGANDESDFIVRSEVIMSDSKKGISRRGFLKGAGTAAAGAALLDAGAFGATGIAEPPVIGPGRTEITLDVNRSKRTIHVEPRTTLAAALRDELDLTGTKISCDRGACSGCTVWLDGVPVASCMTLAVDAAGRKITTIEGLANGDTLHPLQEAFIEKDAMQCGFCTPGMVMTAAALLERNPDPTLDDVKEAVSGNLCRCAVYPQVFDATLAAAKKRRA